jgi:photoactive yellow protein
MPDSIVLQLSKLTESQLDQLPFGVIHVNSEGVVLGYNAFESELSNRSKVQVIGKNFFREVAPCTEVDEFQGRFLAGVRSGRLNEHFQFVFPFEPWPRAVRVHMLGGIDGTAWIFVSDLTRDLTLASMKRSIARVKS